MRIEVKLFATLRIALGRGNVIIDTDHRLTVDELIDEVSRAVGEDIRPWLVTPENEIQIGTMILLEGKNILHMDGLATPVEAATVSIFPPAGGG
ncbi:MAG: MoaD/ThiS family protein [Spirochaeta sp.]|nr:MoaD/ThiS family protein [Spirochaeta sp.]